MTGRAATVRRWCACGAAWRVASDPATAAGTTRLWEQLHSGAGHGPATARQAANARRRDNRARRRGEVAAAEAMYR